MIEIPFFIFQVKVKKSSESVRTQVTAAKEHMEIPEKLIVETKIIINKPPEQHFSMAEKSPPWQQMPEGKE